MPGQRLVKKGPQCKDVASPVNLFSGCLFRGQVERRTNDYIAPRVGRVKGIGVKIYAIGRLVKKILYQAEVEHLYLTTFVDNNIGWFDVAMDNSIFMSLGQCLGNRCDGLDRSAH